MRLVSAHRGELQVRLRDSLPSAPGETVRTGLEAWDELAPEGAFARGAVHELLVDPGEDWPLAASCLLARACQAGRPGDILWCDGARRLYPPALAAAGVDLRRVLLVRPGSAAGEMWALAEALACRGVVAAVGFIERMTRLAARRLQLAAERGGGMGILLRRWGEAKEYAAATRWRVRPLPGELAVQRWALQLVHGHGGQVGRTIVLEACRETDRVRALDPLADRAMAAARRLA